MTRWLVNTLTVSGLSDAEFDELSSTINDLKLFESVGWPVGEIQPLEGQPEGTPLTDANEHGHLVARMRTVKAPISGEVIKAFESQYPDAVFELMFWESTFDSYGLAIAKGGEAAYRVFNGKDVKEFWDFYVSQNPRMDNEGARQRILGELVEGTLEKCRTELLAEITKPSMKERFEAMLAERDIPLE